MRSGHDTLDGLDVKRNGGSVFFFVFHLDGEKSIERRAPEGGLAAAVFADPQNLHGVELAELGEDAPSFRPTLSGRGRTSRETMQPASDPMVGA